MLCCPARIQDIPFLPNDSSQTLNVVASCTKCNILFHDYKMKRENLSWDMYCLIYTTPVRPCGFSSEMTNFIFLSWKWTCLSQNYLKAEPYLFSLSTCFSIGKRRMSSHLETLTSLIQPYIWASMQNQMENYFPAPSPHHPAASSSGTLHVLSPSPQAPSPTHGHQALAFFSWLLPVLVHYILLYLLKCWKVTVKMWNCNF